MPVYISKSKQDFANGEPSADEAPDKFVLAPPEDVTFDNEVILEASSVDYGPGEKIGEFESNKGTEGKSQKGKKRRSGKKPSKRNMQNDFVDNKRGPTQGTFTSTEYGPQRDVPAYGGAQGPLIYSDNAIRAGFHNTGPAQGAFDSVPILGPSGSTSFYDPNNGNIGKNEVISSSYGTSYGNVLLSRRPTTTQLAFDNVDNFGFLRDSYNTQPTIGAVGHFVPNEDNEQHLPRGIRNVPLFDAGVPPEFHPAMHPPVLPHAVRGNLHSVIGMPWRGLMQMDHARPLGYHLGLHSMPPHGHIPGTPVGPPGPFDRQYQEIHLNPEAHEFRPRAMHDFVNGNVFLPENIYPSVDTLAYEARAAHLPLDLVATIPIMPPRPIPGPIPGAFIHNSPLRSQPAQYAHTPRAHAARPATVAPEHRAANIPVPAAPASPSAARERSLSVPVAIVPGASLASAPATPPRATRQRRYPKEGFPVLGSPERSLGASPFSTGRKREGKRSVVASWAGTVVGGPEGGKE